MEGTFGDATPFSSNSVNVAEELCDRLQKNGFQGQGWEVMYNGFTGEPINAKIFIGPCYYQRLKHMVTIGHSNMKNIASLEKLCFSWRHVQIAGTSCKLLVLNYNRNVIMVLVNH